MCECLLCACFNSVVCGPYRNACSASLKPLFLLSCVLRMPQDYQCVSLMCYTHFDGTMTCQEPGTAFA